MVFHVQVAPSHRVTHLRQMPTLGLGLSEDTEHLGAPECVGALSDRLAARFCADERHGGRRPFGLGAGESWARPPGTCQVLASRVNTW